MYKCYSYCPPYAPASVLVEQDVDSSYCTKQEAAAVTQVVKDDFRPF